MKDIRLETTSTFIKQAKKIIAASALQEFYEYIVLHPEDGDIISGAGGLRKARWRSGLNNKGKSGGVRVIYYYQLKEAVILISIYSKSTKEDITLREKKIMKEQITIYLNNLRKK
jgi:mRNA-degrading endonuclease RelE of RelBE toxin-antitoxin system